MKRALRCTAAGVDSARAPSTAARLGGRHVASRSSSPFPLNGSSTGAAIQGSPVLTLVVERISAGGMSGAPISSFQMVQKMLADMAIKTEAARWLVYASAGAIDAGIEEVTKGAAMAKCFATDTAMEVATEAVQVFGGYGFMEEYPVAKLLRDVKIFQIYEGTSEIQRNIIVRELFQGKKQ